MSARDVTAKLEELRRFRIPPSREDFPRDLRLRLTEFIGVLSTVPIPVKEASAGVSPHQIGYSDFGYRTSLHAAEKAARKTQRDLVRAGYPERAATVAILHVPALPRAFKEAYIVVAPKHAAPLTWD